MERDHGRGRAPRATTAAVSFKVGPRATRHGRVAAARRSRPRSGRSTTRTPTTRRHRFIRDAADRLPRPGGARRPVEARVVLLHLHLPALDRRRRRDRGGRDDPQRRRQGGRPRPPTPSGGRWVTAAGSPGETATVEAGGVTDAYGNYNGAASATLSGGPAPPAGSARRIRPSCCRRRRVATCCRRRPVELIGPWRRRRRGRPAPPPTASAARRRRDPLRGTEARRTSAAAPRLDDRVAAAGERRPPRSARAGTARCGGGGDRVHCGPRDDVPGCERVRVPGPRASGFTCRLPRRTGALLDFGRS